MLYITLLAVVLLLAIGSLIYVIQKRKKEEIQQELAKCRNIINQCCDDLKALKNSLSEHNESFADEITFVDNISYGLDEELKVAMETFVRENSNLVADIVSTITELNKMLHITDLQEFKSEISYAEKKYSELETDVQDAEENISKSFTLLDDIARGDLVSKISEIDSYVRSVLEKVVSIASQNYFRRIGKDQVKTDMSESIGSTIKEIMGLKSVIDALLAESRIPEAGDEYSKVEEKAITLTDMFEKLMALDREARKSFSATDQE